MDRYSPSKFSQLQQTFLTSTNPHHSRKRQKSALPNFQIASECSTPKFSLSSISLYSDIEEVLQKLDPSFKLFVSNQSPVTQILQCVRQATYFLLDQHKKPASEDPIYENFRLIYCEHCGNESKNLKTETANFVRSSENLRQKTKRFERQKLIQSEKIKEEKRILGVFKEKLEGLAERLSKQKLEIIEEEFEKKKLRLEIQSVSAQNCQSQKSGFKDLRIETLPSVSVDSAFDFSSLIEALENQIQAYNEEVAIKDLQLSEKEEKLSLRENWVKKQVSDIEMVSLALNNSKRDFFELKEELFPDIEIQLGLVKQTLEELNEQKINLEDFFENYEDLVTENKSWAEFNYLRKETEKKYKENCEYSGYLEQLQQKLDKHFEEKNKELQENSEKLKQLQDNVNLTIQVMESKEKELMKLGLRLKEKEQALMKCGISTIGSNSGRTLETNDMKKYPDSIHRNRNIKSMSGLNTAGY